jgi:hypothetical protein
VYAELGHCWVILLAAFFLIWGYFSTHQVVFRPWGLQNTKNAFYKKMLCDQASDKIFFIYQPASHVPPVSFYNTIDQLSIARVEISWGTATLPTTPDSSGADHPALPTLSYKASLCIGVRSVECSPECSEQDQLRGNRHSY